MGIPMMSQNSPVAAQPNQRAVTALLDDVEGLVSPPDVCMKLFELIHSDATGARDIDEVIYVDPNLTARLLLVA